MFRSPKDLNFIRFEAVEITNKHTIQPFTVHPNLNHYSKNQKFKTNVIIHYQFSLQHPIKWEIK